MVRGEAATSCLYPRGSPSLLRVTYWTHLFLVQKAYQRGNTISMPQTAFISRHLPCLDVGVAVGSGAAVGVDVGVLVGENCGVGVEVVAGDTVGPACG